MRVVRWKNCARLGVAGTFINVHGAYGNIVGAVAPVPTGSRVSDIVEDEDDWILDNIPLSRNADMWVNPRVDFPGGQTQCL